MDTPPESEVKKDDLELKIDQLMLAVRRLPILLEKYRARQALAAATPGQAEKAEAYTQIITGKSAELEETKVELEEAKEKLLII